MLFDLPVDRKPVRFAENVFCAFENGRIAQVWSVIDEAAVAARIRDG